MLVQQQKLQAWFGDLQNQIIAHLESFEKNKSFVRKIWQRSPHSDEGGGTMALLEGGEVFERAGVNISTVYGVFPEAFRQEIPGTEENPHYWASGLSLVIHPRNPYVPIIHMNTRHVITTKGWFGGGIDLTPAIPFDEDTAFLQAQLKELCDRHNPGYYTDFKAYCDRYFYLPHRQEPRGVGGIFYDELNSGSFEADFAFTQDVGRTFLKIYPEIVKRRVELPWSEKERTLQLLKRGRYAEFNLLYDRGTRFGLKTNGNIEAILMSLPPLAQWSTEEAA